MRLKANISIELKASNMTIGFDLGHNLDLELSRSNKEFARVDQKWSDCHETKSKHIDWSIGLKCDHWVWPWTWPWPWIFKVKYEICYISVESGPDVRCSDLPDCDWGDFKCRRAVDSSSYPLKQEPKLMKFIKNKTKKTRKGFFLINVFANVVHKMFCCSISFVELIWASCLVMPYRKQRVF